MAKKTRNINLVDTGVGLALAQTLTQAGTGGAHDVLEEIKIGAWSFALRDLAKNVTNKDIQTKAVGIALGGIGLKFLAKSFGVRKIGGLPGVSLNV